MKVTVKFYAYLRDLVGRKSPVELNLEEGATVSELVDELCMDPQIKSAVFDENLEIRSDITILKNGREIVFLAGMETALDSGDEISIFPLVAGGNQTD